MLESSRLVCIFSILVLCLCGFRWQSFNLLNRRLTFQLIPQSWPSSSCSKRRVSPSLPRRWRSIQTSNSKKIPWYCGGFTELNYSPLLDRKSITGRLQVRAPMGVHKRIHIQRICQLPEVCKLGENGNRDVIFNLPASRGFTFFFRIYAIIEFQIKYVICQLPEVWIVVQQRIQPRKTY